MALFSNLLNSVDPNYQLVFWVEHIPIFEVAMEPTNQPRYRKKYVSKINYVAMEPTNQPTMNSKD